MVENLKRGDILRVNFNNEGCVLSRTHYAICIGYIRNSTTCLVIPLTSNSNKKGYFNHIELVPDKNNGLTKVSYALAESIQCINLSDVDKKTGFIKNKDYSRIGEAVKRLTTF